jgi:hypothetical protein
VESLEQLAIASDLLVAVQAKSGLQGSRERFVATTTFCFELGVPFNDWTRQDELFQEILRYDSTLHFDGERAHEH